MVLGLLRRVVVSGSNWLEGWRGSDKWLSAESLNECSDDRAYSDSRCGDDNTFRPLGVSISNPANYRDDLHHVHREEVGYA